MLSLHFRVKRSWFANFMAGSGEKTEVRTYVIVLCAFLCMTVTVRVTIACPSDVHMYGYGNRHQTDTGTGKRRKQVRIVLRVDSC